MFCVFYDRMQLDAIAGCICIMKNISEDTEDIMNTALSTKEVKEIQVDTIFAAMQMVEVLFAKNMINKATYNNILFHLKKDDREAA